MCVSGGLPQTAAQAPRTYNPAWARAPVGGDPAVRLSHARGGHRRTFSCCVRRAAPRSRVRGPTSSAGGWTNDRVRPPQGQRASYSTTRGGASPESLTAPCWRRATPPRLPGPTGWGRGTRLLTNAVAGPHPSCEHRGWLMEGGRHCLVSTHQLDAEEDCGAG